MYANDSLTLEGNGSGRLILDGGAVASQGAGAVFNMEGGTITNCKANTMGGGVYVYRYGVFNMSAGANISNCTANGGGGVAIDGDSTAGGTFTMHAGSITGCRAKGNGGGIFYNAGRAGYILIDGGTITNCTADAQGGGVYFGAIIFYLDSPAVAGPSGTFCGNTGDNVYKGGDGSALLTGTAANLSTYTTNPNPNVVLW